MHITTSTELISLVSQANGSYEFTISPVAPVDPEDTTCVCGQIYAPVCGDDGVQYSNSCEAECESVSFVTGECCAEGMEWDANAAACASVETGLCNEGDRAVCTFDGTRFDCLAEVPEKYSLADLNYC